MKSIVIVIFSALATATAVIMSCILGTPSTTPAPSYQVSAPDVATVLACPGAPIIAGSNPDTVANGAAVTTDKQFAAEPVRPAISTSFMFTPHTSSMTTKARPLVPNVVGASAKAVPQELPRFDGIGLEVDGRDSDPVRPIAVTIPPTSVPAGVGMTMVRTDGGDLQGIAATQCVEPREDLWLLAGGTSTGESSRVVLANPGNTVATVHLTFHTERGPQTFNPTNNIVVPPGHRYEVLAEGLVPGQQSLAVHVRVAGGSISAWMHDHRIDGVTAAGIDTVRPSPAPSSTVVINGVHMTNSAEGSNRSTSTLRVVNPSSQPAVITWQMHKSGSLVEQASDDAHTLQPGDIKDIQIDADSFDGDGMYSVVVTASTNVLASVVTMTPMPKPVIAADGAPNGDEAGNSPEGASLEGAVLNPDGAAPHDIAWATSNAVIKGPTGVSLVPLPASAPNRSMIMTLRNATPNSATVVVEGFTEKVTAPEAHTITLDADELSSFVIGEVLPDARMVKVSSTGEVTGAVVIDQQGSSAVLPIVPESSRDGAVTVRQGPADKWP